MSKKDHNLAKILQNITNIVLDLYFTVIQSSAKLNEINAFLQKLLSWNKKCDNDTDVADADVNDDDDTDRQHDPYVSAMLRRRHKKYHQLIICWISSGSGKS